MYIRFDDVNVDCFCGHGRDDVGFFLIKGSLNEDRQKVNFFLVYIGKFSIEKNRISDRIASGYFQTSQMSSRICTVRLVQYGKNGETDVKKKYLL